MTHSSFTSNPAGLVLQNVSRRYGGTKALDGFSCTVPAGATCAFIGANGAGKTTTFSILGGFLRRYRGRIGLEFPANAQPNISLRSFRAAGGVIGLMPQDVQAFEDRTILAQLLLFSRLAGRSPREANVEVEGLLHATDLFQARRAEVASLSHGMRARFGIAQAFVGQPGVVLLDEPTGGLDPLHLAQVRKLLISFKGRTTLMISSHDLSELQGLCDYVVMIEAGRCIKQGRLDEVVGQKELKSFWNIRGVFAEAQLQAAFPTLKFNLFDKKLEITSSLTAKNICDLIAWFDAADCAVLAFDRRTSLEEVYLEQVRT